MANSTGDPWQNVTAYPQDTDTSMYPFPGDMWLVRPTTEITIKIVTLLPIALIGIFGNVSLLHAITSNRQLRSNTTNLLILNMAVADLCTCLFCPGMFVVVDVFQNYRLGEIGCRLDGFLVIAFILVAVFSLSAVSYDRVSAIVLNCHGKLTVRNTYILVAISWTLALVVASPLAIFRSCYVRVWKNFTEKFCGETKNSWTYWYLIVGVSVWMPLAVMAVCYTTILIKLDRYEKQALKSKHPIAVKYKGRVARMLSLVVLAFIVGRVPFAAFILRLAQQKMNNDDGIGRTSSMYASRYLVFVNAALNPLLYGYTNRSLRQELANYPPVFWFILRRRQEKERVITSTLRQNSLIPRSACSVEFDDKVDVPTISSTVGQSKSFQSSFFRKLRIHSVVGGFSGTKIEDRRSMSDLSGKQCGRDLGDRD